MEEFVTKSEFIQAMNTWMQRYVESPEAFAREWETIHRYLDELGSGDVPSYGQTCWAYLSKLLSEI